MLDGIRTNQIIVGAYSDQGGICPMLAAHRAGGRTSFIAFARAWDGFAFRGTKVQRARRASDRELLVLRTHLEASLLQDEAPVSDLAGAITEHRALIDRPRPVRPAHPGEPEPEPEPDRSAELRRREGSTWIRVMRRYDDYQRTLEALEALEASQQPGHELVRV